MPWGWFAGVIILAAADWLAVGLNRPRWRVVTKPAPMLLLLVLFTLYSGWQGAGVLVRFWPGSLLGWRYFPDAAAQSVSSWLGGFSAGASVVYCRL